MKIGGVDPRTLPTEEVLVLPKGESVIVFKARGITDWDEFQKLCPEPKIPQKFTKEGWVPNPQDKNYVTDNAEYGKRRLAYMVVKSLEPSQIEWETVEPANPGTWANWEQDLKNAKFTQVECNRVVGLVLEANCLNEEKLEKARKVFLLGPQTGSADTSGQSTEPATSQSGEPASV